MLDTVTNTKIVRALLSLSDKTGLLELVLFLHSLGVELISTGGTAKAIRDHGIPVIDISTYTGFPEMLDGRVKTLHPKVHGGLLFIRGNASHEAVADEYGIRPIDLVVVNLYPFEQTVAKLDVTLHDAIENIDIGGPSMLRSAAKNHDSVTVVVDPADYGEVQACIKANDGATTLELRRRLAAKVFRRTSRYDGAIADYLESRWLGQDLPTLSYPTRELESCKSQMTGQKYPDEFVSELKGQFPEWSDMHKALDEGDWAVGQLLQVAGTIFFPPTAEEIMASSGERHARHIKYRASITLRTRELLVKWVNIVKQWQAAVSVLQSGENT